MLRESQSFVRFDLFDDSEADCGAGGSRLGSRSSPFS
jgi:hypothetical protein